MACSRLAQCTVGSDSRPERGFIPQHRVYSVCSALAGLAVLCVFAATAEASFPGQNGRLAFSAETAFKGLGQNAVLWDYSPATRRGRQLTRRAPGCRESPGSYSGTDEWVDGGLDYSPDGRRIAYLHADNCPAGETRTGLWIMSADGRAKRHVASFDVSRGSILVGEAEAAFSHDGRSVAVLNYAGGDPRGHYALTVFRRTDGTVQQQLFFDGSGAPEGIDWGANGRLVIAIEDRLHVLWPNGGGERRLRFPRSGRWLDGAPDWSPNGRAFVFHAARFADERVRGEALWLGSPRTTTADRLTRGGFPSSPVFSPDGRYIAFVDDNGLIARFPTKRDRPSKLVMGLRGRMELIWSISWQPLRRQR